MQDINKNKETIKSILESDKSIDQKIDIIFDNFKVKKYNTPISLRPKITKESNDQSAANDYLDYQADQW